ncbi:MAG: ROK family protein [Mycoplasmatales bacterium]
MKNYIGIDVGGTNLRIARFNDFIELEEVIRYETEVELGIEQIFNKLVDGINKLKNNQTLGIGMSVPGQVDIKNGIILACTNIPFSNTEVEKILFKRTGLHTVLNNDANVAGLGEAIKGAASDVDNSYFITWSTGIGGALIINNDIVTGNNVYSGEVGNIIIWPNDNFKHSVMAKGAVEGLTSGTALKRYAENLGYSHAGELIDSARSGNEEALKIVNYVADNFARLIATIIHVVEVDMFVIGGGVTIKSGDILLPIVKKRVNEYLMPIMKDQIIIKEATLGDDAGIVGSAFLAKNKFK